MSQEAGQSGLASSIPLTDVYEMFPQLRLDCSWCCLNCLLFINTNLLSSKDDVKAKDWRAILCPSPGGSIGASSYRKELP